MADELREVDWSSSPLGPPSSWPPALQTTMNICLTSRFPMLLWWGPELRLLYNDAYRPMLGEKHPASLGAPGREVWPEIWDEIGPMLSQVVDEGVATWSSDHRLVLHRHGFPEECFFTFSYSPIHDDDGRVAGVFTAVTETTDRVLVDRRLRTIGALATATRDARTVDEATKGAVRALGDVPDDVPFSLLYVREGDTRVLRLAGATGVAEDEVPARVDLDGPTPGFAIDRVVEKRAAIESHATSDELPASLSEQYRTTPAQVLTLPLLDVATDSAAGALVLGLSPHRPIDREYREFAQLVADQVAKGIVDARAAESERERAAALAELNHAKARFFSNVSHEFRTPLTLLQGPLAESLADDEDPLSASQRRRIEMAKRNADRMGRLVGALLDFSRLESGRATASYRSTDLTELTRELASAFPSAIEGVGLAYELDIAELPLPVHVDREMWEKIVFNLLSNAIKFTFDGSITVRLCDDGTHAVLEVIDTGVGIAPDEVPHLFERFHRIREARSRSQEGTGIGLALVKELVELHGGAIEVDTEADRGSCFRVRVPYGTSHLPADQVDAEPQLPTTAVSAETYIDEVSGWSDAAVAEHAHSTDPGNTAGAKLLVVDDNADMRSYLTRLLGQHWQVRAVADGRHALEELRSDRPDLVLADVLLPGMDGFELLDAIRSDAELRDLPVVMLSARASETSRVEGMDHGADDYLVKPFTVAELIARVRGNLHLSAQRIQTADIRARQAMLAGLSHEMQTPLAAILGSIAIVEQAAVPDPVQPAISIMRRQAAQLRGLVQQFLDFSRLEAGRDPVLQVADHDPAELISAAVEVCGNARLEVDDRAPLPRVTADADRVEQILTNLCTNALKFTGDGTTVSLGARREEGQVVFTVLDRGIGIPDDEAELIFERFFRGRSGDEVAGTGLGLYVSRALAEAMGGTLTLRRDRDEAGAAFELALPIAVRGGDA